MQQYLVGTPMERLALDVLGPLSALPLMSLVHCPAQEWETSTS